MGTVRRGRHFLERDGRAIVPVGAHFVPVEGPDWPWRVGADAFDAAFGRMAAAGLDTVRIDLPWAAIEPEPGRYDEAHLAVLDAVLAAARRHGLLLHPTLFVGGEVGDAYWDVPWRAGRHPHRDPELVRLQVAQATMLAGRWRGDPAILAWDLTDEPPQWLFPDTTDEDAAGWTTALAEALRAADPEHLVTIGTASQEIGAGPFRADVVAGGLDFSTVHPYPIYSPELYPDGLLGSRMTHAAAFETALAAGAGRPVMVHEYGASSAQFDPDLIAAYDRLLAWSALGRGAIGALAWCWTDAEPAAYRRAPYVRQPHETQFGVTDHRGNLRPRGRVLAELAATIRATGDELDGLAGDGPLAAAAIPVPHEYVAPYDPAAYGLGDAPAGPYEPAERVWSPVRDPRLLVRGWLNAFVLAARAGVAVGFPRERLDDAWPDTRLLIVPAPLTTTSSTLHHLRTSFWRGAADHFARGGSLWLSVSADAALPEMAELAGCHLADRVPADRPGVLRFVALVGAVRARRRARAARRRRHAGDPLGAARRRRRRGRGRRPGRRPGAGAGGPGIGRRGDLRRAGRAPPGERPGGPWAGQPEPGTVRRAHRALGRPRARRRRPSRRDDRDARRTGRRRARRHEPRSERSPDHAAAARRSHDDPDVRRSRGPSARDGGGRRRAGRRGRAPGPRRHPGRLAAPAVSAPGPAGLPAILAVDGGNSKADVALVMADGSVLGAMRGPTVSHQAVGLEAGLDALERAVAAGHDRGRPRRRPSSGRPPRRLRPGRRRPPGRRPAPRARAAWDAA